MNDVQVRRPRAVDFAFAGALSGAAIAALLLALADRSMGYLGIGAAVSAVVSLGLAFPMRAGRTWARWALGTSAMLGVLCAPAVANSKASMLTFTVGGALVVVWAAVVGLLVRADVRAYAVVRSMRS